MSGSKRVAIAFRSQVFPPISILELVKTIEEYDGSPVSNIFLPDTLGGYDSLEIAAAALALTKKLHIGTGVIRILEHDEKLLKRRIEAIQALSENRFVLGVGTGTPGSKPRETIQTMIQRLDSLAKSFKASTSGVSMPLTYVAALKVGIARQAIGHCSGLLLNFCSPSYARSVIAEVADRDPQADFSCYMKVFYSRSKTHANRLLIEEFMKYDSLRQYHEMFERDGVENAIKETSKKIDTTPDLEIPEPMRKICLANPSLSELKEYVASFLKSGVTLPCIYPYFSAEDDLDFRRQIVRQIVENV